MKNLLLLFAVSVSAPLIILASDEVRRPNVLVLPGHLIPSVEPSPKMDECVARLEADGVFSRLREYRSLDQVPDWCVSSEDREVAYRSEPGDDSFRYAIFLSGLGSVVIVRAGGISDIYEVFEIKAAEPGATDNPDDAQRLREDH